MNWQEKKIAYWPYDKEFAVPGDRRRFVFYAKERGINFEFADPFKKYNIVYLTYGCNIDVWMKYKKDNPDTKIIFELIDSYLLEDPGFFTYLRGMIRFILKKESRLYFNYKKALRKMIGICDAVVCSTPIQKQDLSRYQKNIHISLDYFSNDITCHKTNYQTNGKLKLVWEGQAYTVKNLLEINDVLDLLKNDIELHIVTDSVIKYPFKIFNKSTKKILQRLKCSYQLHNWDKQTFAKILADCDLSIIPISSKSSLMWNKPENKLLLLWEIGIPVLTSDTPAYKRVMDAAGIDSYCLASETWVKKIKRHINYTPIEKQNLVAQAKGYLNAHHEKETILKKWDAIFESVYV